VRITAADGHETSLEVFGVAGQRPVLFIPALGVPISYYELFLGELADAGNTVHGLELRGMPNSSITNVRRTDFGYHDLLTLDIPAAIAAMPAQPVAVVGHSLGGQLALLYAASNPGFAAPLVAIASGSSFHRSVGSRRGRLIRRRQAAAVPLIAHALGYFPGHVLGFGGKQPVSMMHDWGFEAQNGRYGLRGGDVDLEAGLARLTNRVLMVTVEGDKYINPAAADVLGERLTSASVTRVHLDRSHNGGELFDHFRWARRNPAPIVHAIAEFLGA